ncbi:MAG: transglycosylase domain-containing protein [Deltaproteobacteria bacterium]|nr:transglycosylase domain-containing protein [Deltaproteobacteria bacterium]
MVGLLLSLLLSDALGRDLEHTLGRTQVQVLSAPSHLIMGRTPAELQLAERLERLGYTQVHTQPRRPGEYFIGHQRVWVYRRAHSAAGRRWPDALLGLSLTDGRISGALSPDGAPRKLPEGRGWWLEPELLSTSLTEVRAPVIPVRLEALPERVWRPLLALEDDRFFEHAGVSPRAVARAAVANARAGRSVQGGSTLTQQLVKNRDLTPRRGLDRKASEAVRALTLEARYSKEQLLQAYLNTVYYGHVDGVALHGLGTAARVYFSKVAADLTLPEAATLAAVVQGPNALSPLNHPDAARARRDLALSRMEALGWIRPEEASAARATPLVPSRSAPTAPLGRHFRQRVHAEVQARHPRRLERGLGLSVETTLDPWLQAQTETVVRQHLDPLQDRGTSHGDTQIAVVSLRGDSGEVAAWIGGGSDSLDRASLARRQPGSTIKPLLLLEAFERCGPQRPLHPASLISDQPLTLELGDEQTWSPSDYDGKNRGLVSARVALRDSLNLPFVRISQYCGADAQSALLRRAGLELPSPPPPSFALGAVETTPVALASAYTAFSDLGVVSEAHTLLRIETPRGRRLSGPRARRHRISSPQSAWLVRELMRGAVEEGTGKQARIRDLDVAGKTGTSTMSRDAWFAGEAAGLVTVVWLGQDDGGSLQLTGGSGAAPIYRDLSARGALAAGRGAVTQPRGIVTRTVDPANGLVVGLGVQVEGVEEQFREGAIPRASRFWRKNKPARVIE